MREYSPTQVRHRVTVDRMKSVAMSLLLAGASVGAANAPTFSLWTPGNVKQVAQELAAKLNPQGLASQKLADMGNYNFSLALRRQSGTAEVHQKMADIFVIESGEADLVTGGKVVDATNSSPDEIRGTGIEGGVEHHVAAGDVLTIPAGMPHQLKVAPGKEVLYMAIKVAQ
jgi:mannose-6-phosphate isomerase-like protein (cupin superfamily)